MSAEQQQLVPTAAGHPRLGSGRLPAEAWAELLTDPVTIARYRAKVARRRPDQC